MRSLDHEGTKNAKPRSTKITKRNSGVWFRDLRVSRPSRPFAGSCSRRFQLPPTHFEHTRKITLPTECQWEKAARGHDGRQYPWGSKYEEGRANIDERYQQAGTHCLDKTTAVGMYRHSAPDDSPYGVADLSGNVWEWCLNDASSGETDLAGFASRVLRGGSWNDVHYDATATAQSLDIPNYRHPSYGVRVVVVGWRPND